MSLLAPSTDALAEKVARAIDPLAFEKNWRARMTIAISQAHAVIDAMQTDELLAAFEALIVDVENKWGDPHTLRQARAVWEKYQGGTK